MKNFKTIAIALLVAFGATTASAQTKKIDPAKSKVSWIGKKVTGQHEGYVKLTEGYFVFDGNNLMAGAFTVDMSSITVTDLQAGKGKEKLEGHLKSDDFFGTDQHPTATLAFKSATAKGGGVYTINGQLTIKGKTNPITLDITIGKNSAVSTFRVDRTKYDIKYGSGSFFDNLGDKAINDQFEVTANLAF